MEISTTGHFIYNQVLGDQVLVDSKKKKASRVALKALGVLLAGASNIPYIKVNYDGGGGNPILGSLLVYGNAASFTCLNAWASNALIDSYLAPKSQEERLFLLVRKTERCKEGSIFVISLVLGIAAQFPIAYFGYQANTSGPFPAIAMPITSIAADSVLTISSMKGSLDALLKGRRVTEFEKGLQRIRDEILSFVEANQKVLAGEDRGRARQYAEVLKALSEREDREVIGEYLQAITAPVEDSSLPRVDGRAWTLFTNGLGGAVAAAQIGVLGYISYLGMDQLFHSTGANVTACIIAGGANTYLQGGSILSTTKRVCNAVKSFFLGTYEKNLNERVALKCTLALRAITIATALLSYGAPWEMTASFEKVNHDLRVYLGVSFSVGTFLLITTAMFDLTDQLLSYSLSRYGSEEIKLLLEVKGKMESFSKFLQKSPFIELARFFSVLPQPLLDRLNIASQNTQLAFREYIEEIEARDAPSEDVEEADVELLIL